MSLGTCELCGEFKDRETLRLTFMPHDATDPSVGDLIPTDRVSVSPPEDEFVLEACETCRDGAYEVADSAGYVARS